MPVDLFVSTVMEVRWGGVGVEGVGLAEGRGGGDSVCLKMSTLSAGSVKYFFHYFLGNLFCIFID